MVGGEGVCREFVLGAFFSHTPVPLEIACACSNVVRLNSASIFVSFFVSYLRASFSLAGPTTLTRYDSAASLSGGCAAGLLAAATP